jgi:hypothetical protein
VLWDLTQAARAKCPEALEFVYETMRDTDESRDVRLKAASILLERGYGKAKEMLDVSMTHSFAEVPQVMGLNEWLARKGQPPGADGDEWLRQRGATGVATIPEKRTSEAPSARGGPPVIDLQAEDPLLTAVDPTEPRPPGSKLN